mgnify:CR=1 FL=1
MNLDKRSPMERMRVARDQKRGTVLSKRDVETLMPLLEQAESMQRVVAAADAFYDCDLLDFDKKLAELGKALGARGAPAAETTKKDQAEDTEVW